jgi:hypothetical protein
MATGMSALSSIGIGTSGTDLQSQVAGESDDERRKRLQQQQQARLLGNSTGATALGSSTAASPAPASIGGAGMGRWGI